MIEIYNTYKMKTFRDLLKRLKSGSLFRGNVNYSSSQSFIATKPVLTSEINSDCRIGYFGKPRLRDICSTKNILARPFILNNYLHRHFSSLEENKTEQPYSISVINNLVDATEAIENILKNTPGYITFYIII